MSDLRDEFEAMFPIPRHCERCGDGYAVTEYDAWEAIEYQATWKGFKAARNSLKIKLPFATWVDDIHDYVFPVDCVKGVILNAGVSYE